MQDFDLEFKCFKAFKFLVFFMSEQESQNTVSKNIGSVAGNLNQGQFLVNLIQSKLGQHISQHELSCGDAVVYLQRTGALDFFRILKVDSELSFDFLVDITAVDWMDTKEQRFSLVYHLMSHKYLYRLRVKIPVPETDPEVESVSEIWNSANFLEREVWDMYGIKFKGHPDLRRVLMYDEFKGHPLRKDYPLQGKQPRVKLRYPEVENTARHMLRDTLVRNELVNINTRSRN